MKDNLAPSPPVQPDTPTPRRTGGQRLLAAALVVLVLLAGLVAAWAILHSSPKARRSPPPRRQTPVAVQEVRATTLTPELTTLGTVLSSRRLSLAPAISGTVLWLNPKLIPGGRLRKGELVLRLDDREYQLARARRRNQLEQASMDLRLEQGSQAVARREYQLIQQLSETDLSKAPLDLALREPQLAKARAAEATARTEVALAELDLERTSLVAPFNGLVLEKQVALGAQLNRQSVIATLVGTDHYWVRVTLPQEQLAKIQLPSPGQPGAEVLIQGLGDQQGRPPRRGQLIRLLGEVDPDGLLARLLIEVDQPLAADAGQAPLLLGSTVSVRIPALPLENVFPIPRGALHGPDTLLIATPDQTLEIRTVNVAWLNGDLAYVAQGLENGELVITSPLSAPIPGMELALEP
ncbi:efflux RND transporter periplasmic adaptor subunit [Desulfogranum mediterraneum]|uniref:efflux RND transporter periplasmic adaptor subunit n=1 Tax=Desulfogranum mediterraneum TaxID=160661 RepID=UPI0004257020|nr:efflux RND transporter periplasmic adaptor subunit [Desulfogranum mediterraneum]